MPEQGTQFRSGSVEMKKRLSQEVVTDCNLFVSLFRLAVDVPKSEYPTNAQQLFRDCLSFIESLRGGSELQLDTAIVYLRLAEILHFLGNNDEARNVRSDSLDLFGELIAYEKVIEHKGALHNITKRRFHAKLNLVHLIFER